MTTRSKWRSSQLTLRLAELLTGVGLALFIGGVAMKLRALRQLSDDATEEAVQTLIHSLWMEATAVALLFIAVGRALATVRKINNAIAHEEP